MYNKWDKGNKKKKIAKHKSSEDYDQNPENFILNFNNHYF